MVRSIFVILSICFWSLVAQDAVIQIIKSEGHLAELHSVTTDDSYILNVHRIRPPKPTPKIVLIMHGVQINSYVYVFPRSYSLAFQLANDGYDVWIGNARGTQFSKNHQTLDTNSADFWDFSFHEIANYDLPAIIDTILLNTNRSALHYAGNSQGTTVIMALLALRPEYNKKIFTMHLMTPVVFFRNVLPGLKTLGPLVDMVEGTFDAMDISREIFIVDDDIRKTVAGMCHVKSFTYKICENYLNLLAGPSSPGWNDFVTSAALKVDNVIFLVFDYTHGGLFESVRLHYKQNNYTQKLFTNTTELFQHIPNSVSLRQIVHYIQLFRDGKGRFLQYDHQRTKNLRLYNQTEPPEYNLKNVRAKIHIIYGTNDNVAYFKDVEELIELFRPMIIGVDRMVGWNHADFLIGKDAGVINKKIIKLMNQYSGT